MNNSIKELLLFLPVTVLLVEMLLSFYWVEYYFRSGITVFEKTIYCNKFNGIPCKTFLKSISTSFPNRMYNSFDFNCISNNEIGIFYSVIKTFIRIGPSSCIHGRLISSNDGDGVKLVGYLNWFWLSLLFSFIIFLLIDFSTSTLGLLLFVALLYYLLIQHELKMYKKIQRFLEEDISKSKQADQVLKYY